LRLTVVLAILLAARPVLNWWQSRKSTHGIGTRLIQASGELSGRGNWCQGTTSVVPKHGLFRRVGFSRCGLLSN
jgi:hypothetical protein